MHCWQIRTTTGLRKCDIEVQGRDGRERDAFLDEHKTKYAASSRADWAKRYDKDPESTRGILAAAGDLVPAVERGHADSPEPTEAGPTSLAQVREDPTYKSWEF